MMSEYSILGVLAQHPWLVVLLLVVVLVILLLPYEIAWWTDADGTHHEWRALLWMFECEPRRTRVRLCGLLRFQRIVLRGSARLWVQGQVRFWAGVQEMLRRWLG